jgi:hypothetical protein
LGELVCVPGRWEATHEINQIPTARDLIEGSMFPAAGIKA